MCLSVCMCFFPIFFFFFFFFFFFLSWLLQPVHWYFNSRSLWSRNRDLIAGLRLSFCSMVFFFSSGNLSTYLCGKCSAGKMTCWKVSLPLFQVVSSLWLLYVLFKCPFFLNKIKPSFLVLCLTTAQPIQIYYNLSNLVFFQCDLQLNFFAIVRLW